MAIGISTITSLGTVLDEDCEINNKIMTVPRPLGDSSNTTALNLFGKTRTIIIRGSFSGTPTEIKAFIDNVETWANTDVQTSRVFTDSFGHTYDVLCGSFQWTRTTPGTRVLYVITMIQGSALAIFGL